MDLEPCSTMRSYADDSDDRFALNKVAEEDIKLVNGTMKVRVRMNILEPLKRGALVAVDESKALDCPLRDFWWDNPDPIVAHFGSWMCAPSSPPRDRFLAIGESSLRWSTRMMVVNIGETAERLHERMSLLSLEHTKFDRESECVGSLLNDCPNVLPADRTSVLGILGLGSVATHDKYLGLPTVIGRNKKRTFASICDKVQKRVRGWKRSFFSVAGRRLRLRLFYKRSQWESVSTEKSKGVRLQGFVLLIGLWIGGVGIILPMGVILSRVGTLLLTELVGERNGSSYVNPGTLVEWDVENEQSFLFNPTCQRCGEEVGDSKHALVFALPSTQLWARMELRSLFGKKQSRLDVIVDFGRDALAEFRGWVWGMVVVVSFQLSGGPLLGYLMWVQLGACGNDSLIASSWIDVG
uniref:Uncharacterized protein n=1 Tax=Cannabis sativa TaxID=3483 RepID=A0A803NW44_CANSA